MDKSDKDVEQELDDIFDGEFIDKEKKEDNIYKSYDNNSSISFVDSKKEEIKKMGENKIEPIDHFLYNNITNEIDVNKDIKVEDNKINIIEDDDNKKDNTENKKVIVKRKKENKKSYNDKKEKKKKDKKIFKFKVTKPDKSTKKFVIIMLILIVIMISILIIKNVYFKEKVIVCNYKANLKEYKITDNYQITKKGNEILSVIGTYKYEVLTESYKEQLPYIKSEKLPVIINSMGMSGFTYVPEETDTSLTVNSYLDFTKFKYNEIKKINQKKKPLFYIEINEDLTYKKLIKILKKKDYVCK